MKDQGTWVPAGSEINVDLCGDARTDGDLEELKSAISPFGKVSGQKSYEVRGLGLHLTLAFVSLAIATGFFNALGTDAYAWLKEKIRKIARNPYERSGAADDPDESDFFAFIITDADTNIEAHLYGSYGNEHELGEFLRAAPRAFATISKALESSRYPCVLGREHMIVAHWRKSPDPEWDMTIQVRNLEDAPEIWFIDATAFVLASEFTIADWGTICWMNREEARRHRRSRRGED